jgi:hypothetical protein
MCHNLWYNFWTPKEVYTLRAVLEKLELLKDISHCRHVIKKKMFIQHFFVSRGDQNLHLMPKFVLMITLPDRFIINT